MLFLRISDTLHGAEQDESEVDEAERRTAKQDDMEQMKKTVC